MRGIEILCAVLMAILMAPSASAASNATDFSVLDKVIQEELKTTNTPGCAVAIVSGDKIVYAKGFGTADIETSTPVTPDTLFRIGSTSKIFTALALVTLAEQGKVDLNKSLDNYISGLSPRLSKVTAGQLLSHTAGLKDQAESWGPHDESALKDYVLSINDSLFFSEPGEVFSYANPGFAVAGYLAEKESGKNYADLIDDTLLKPLEMNRTTFRPTTAMTYPLSQGHSTDANGTVKVVRPFTDNSNYWPAGFAFSSANDLSDLAIALMNQGTFDGKTVIYSSVMDTMSRPRAPVPSSFYNESYGYGLMIHDYRGLKVVEHGGDIEGFTCVFKMVPDHKFALIILDNSAGKEMPNSTKKAFEMMLPLKPEVQETPLPMNESEMASYVGNYSQDPQHPENATSVIMEDGKLLLNVRGHEYPMEKVENDRLAITLPGMEPICVGLVPDKDGRIKYFHFGLRAYPKIGS
jgi:CubicO group peptidase (beta-lactamase class C family)